MIDAWMLRRFPGRTLEELDTVDWFRFMRALEAERIEKIEERRELHVTGKLEAKDLSTDDWESIKRHDELLAEYS